MSQGIMHVYNHTIQRSSPLRLLGQSKSNFIGLRKHLYKGGTNLIINNPDHMTKMAAMPTYMVKTLQKSSLQELLNLLNET